MEKSDILVTKEFNSWKKILDLAMQIGKKLLECGAEIQRVEQTVSYICNAYGATSVDVFAIPNMIVATVESHDMYYTTKIKRIYSSSNNLYMLEKLNALSRYICKELPSYDEIIKMIKDINEAKIPKYPYLIVLGSIIGAGSFSLFFGGSIRDALAASIAALFMSLLMVGHKNVINKTVHTVILSLLGGLLSILFTWIGIGENASYVMIGCIMVLIPGLALGISIRDILADDILSGSLRMFQSIFTALTIALGFSIAINIFSDSIGNFFTSVSPLKMVITSFIGTIGFGLVNNNNYKHLLIVGIGGGISILAYIIAGRFISNIFITTMIGAMVVTIFAEIMARLFKAPATVFLITSMIPLAPGSYLYASMFYLAKSNYIESRNNLLYTAYVALGIGAGIIIVTVIVKLIQRLRIKIKDYKIKKNQTKA